MAVHRSLPVLAIGLAGAALVVAIVAVGIIVTRDEPKPAAPAALAPLSAAAAPAAAGARVVDLDVDANDVAKLLGKATFASPGFRVDDEATRKVLGLELGDLVTSLSGHELKTELSMDTAIADLGLTRMKTIYAEVQRGSSLLLLRWRVSGDLRTAYYSSSTRPQLGFDPVSPNPTAPDPDDVFAKIIKVDDTHFEIPSVVIDAVMANPMSAAKGARVVPAMKNGAPEGFKLYAIRPSSPYARLGLQNGDTIKAINGHALTSVDKALEVYTKLRDAKTLEVELIRRGDPVTLHYKID